MIQFAKKSSLPSILILGAGVTAGRIYREVVEQRPQTQNPIIGFVSLGEIDSEIPGSLILKTRETLSQLARRLRVSEIVVAQDHPNQVCSTQELLDCKLEGVRLSDMEYFLRRISRGDETRRHRFHALLPYFRRNYWRN